MLDATPPTRWMPLDAQQRQPLLALVAQDPNAWPASFWEATLATQEVYGLFLAETQLLAETQIDAELVGVLVLGPGPFEMELLYLLVAPAWRGRGLGRRLIEKALACTQSAQLERLLLEVRVSNLAALRLYQAAGFETLGRRKNYYPSASEPSGREDAWVLGVTTLNRG